MAKQVAVGPVEGPWALPAGWRWERMNTVAPVNPRRGPDNLTDGTEVTFVPMAAVEAETGRIDVSSRKPIGSARKGFTRFGSNDVIFAKITPCMENGKIAVIPDLLHGIGFGSTEFHVLAPQDVSSRYLYYWVSQREFREAAEFNMTGTAGQKRVPADFMRDALVPVPPRPVQDAIVARIDELFAEIDDGEAALVRARVDLATWRKTLLKSAVTGELTADWRSLKGVVSPNEADLPTTWRLANIGSIATSLDNMRRPISKKVRQDRLGTVPYYGANGPVGLIDDHIFNEPLVLVVEDETFTGRKKDFSYIVRGKSWVNNHAHVLRASDKVSTEYLNFCLAQYPFVPLTTGTTGRKKLTKAALMGAPIPVPPADEQAEICSILAQTENRGDYLREMIAAIEPASATLRQTILAAAFRGDLA